MKLLLFESANGEVFVVPERLQAREGSPTQGTSKWQKLRSRIHDGYQRLKERFSHEERVCSDLRHANQLELFFSPRWSQETAEEKLRGFLKRNYRKHTRWMWIDGVVACFGALLTPIPGPNMFFFYPAVRTFSHFLAREGAGKALKLPTSSEHETMIEDVQRSVNKLETVRPEVYALQEKHNIQDLEYQLKHL